MSAYIWDLDGTLLDSYKVITKAAVMAASGSGVKDSAEEVLKKVKRASLTAYLKDVSAHSGETFDSLSVSPAPGIRRISPSRLCVYRR